MQQWRHRTSLYVTGAFGAMLMIPHVAQITVLYLNVVRSMIGPAGSLDPILARALIARYESGGNQNGPGDPCE